MLKTGDKDIVGIRCFGKVISMVKHQSRTLWQSVRSCFGSGRWMEDKPWMDDEGWKDS